MVTHLVLSSIASRDLPKANRLKLGDKKLSLLVKTLKLILRGDIDLPQDTVEC